MTLIIIHKFLHSKKKFAYQSDPFYLLRLQYIGGLCEVDMHIYRSTLEQVGYLIFRLNY
jgi:hypothetical protein